MRRLLYLLREAVTNVLTNRTTTLVAVATTAFTFACVGVFLLLYVNLKTMATSLEQDIQVMVYLQDDVTEQARNDIEQQLKADRGIIYSSPQSVPGFTDIDNDGDMDILTFSSTGFKIEYHQNQSKELYGISDSLVFDMVDYCWGNISENSCSVTLNDCPLQILYNESVQKVLHAGSCLMCFDRDNDGDQDIFIKMGGAIEGDVYQSLLFENPGNQNNWITIKCVGVKSNKAAIGTALQVICHNKENVSRSIFVRVGTGGSFGSSSLQQEIGLGDAVPLGSLIITWPDGKNTKQVFSNIKMNQKIKITEGNESFEKIALKKITF